MNEGLCEEKDLKILQRLPLEEKIKQTKMRIIEWYSHFDGKVYISFSGGKDSTVLLHIARSIYPDIKAVFCDTGLEFPEIRDFVKTIDNVTWVKPKLTFKEVIEKYGWPVISKEQSCYIDQWRNTKNEKLRDVRWNGKSEYKNKATGKISKKWQYMAKDAPFKISDRCCYALKKAPFKSYETKNKEKPIIGTMSGESAIRAINFRKNGCNAFDLKRPTSTPISFWNEEDIWDYIRLNEIKYSTIYNMGYQRTGCMFCLFGYHLELKKGQDRLALLEKTHKKVFSYCMDKLGMREVLKWYPKEIK